MKKLALLAVMLCGALLIYFTVDFPDFGDLNSPASKGVSTYYIEHTLSDTDVPNAVTSILADYRGYDTMFETTVIFAAGLACFLLIRISGKVLPDSRLYRHISTGVTIRIEKGGKLPSESSVFEPMDSLWTPEDLIIKTTTRLLVPFIQIFAFYVVAHGHHSPGGGFQGGVILGASLILFAVSFDLRQTIRRYPEKMAAVLSAIGVSIYVSTGAICLYLGANFLDYSELASLFKVTPAQARSNGIMSVEIGVAVAVMAVMIWIYYNLSSAGKHDEGL